MNSVTIIGFVGADPEQGQARNNGSKFTVLSVATQRSWKSAEDEWVSKVEWHRMVFRPLLAERVATTVNKAAYSSKALWSARSTSNPTAKATSRKPRRLRGGRFALMSYASSTATNRSRSRPLRTLRNICPKPRKAERSNVRTRKALRLRRRAFSFSVRPELRSKKESPPALLPFPV
jgi:hypothetical protein